MLKTHLVEYLQTYLWVTLTAIVLWLLKSRLCPHWWFEVTPVTSNFVFVVTVIWGCWTTLVLLGLTPKYDPIPRENYEKAKKSYERRERQAQEEARRLADARVGYEEQIRLAEVAEGTETAEGAAEVPRRKRAKRNKSDKPTAKYTTRFDRIGK
jgi:hypothetical protein